jgi:hypothetical protein
MADDFFDRFALVKRHVNENGSKWVRSLIRAKATFRIHLARITAVEVFAAITRRQHGGTSDMVLFRGHGPPTNVPHKGPQ